MNVSSGATSSLRQVSVLHQLWYVIQGKREQQSSCHHLMFDRILPTLFLFVVAAITQAQLHHTIPFGELDFSDTLRAGELDQLRTHCELLLPDGTYHPLPDTADANDGLFLITEEQGASFAHQVYEEGERNWSHGPVSRSVDGRYFLVSIRQTNFSRGHRLGRGGLR